MINRTRFIKFLETLDYEDHKYFFSKYSGNNCFAYPTKHEFDEALKETIELLIKYDEKYKEEQKSLPLLKVFLSEQTKKRHGYYTFEIKFVNGKTYTYQENELRLLFGENSNFLNDYVVTASEVIVTKQGHYVNPAEWSYDTLLCKVTVDKKEDYDNIKTEED